MLAVRNRAQSHDALQRFSLSECDDPSRVPVDADAVTRTPSAAILFCSFFSFNMFVSTSPLGRCSITTITTCSHLHTFHVLHDDPFRMVFFKKSLLFKDDYNFWLLSLKTFSITFAIRNVILRVETLRLKLSSSLSLHVYTLMLIFVCRQVLSPFITLLLSLPHQDGLTLFLCYWSSHFLTLLFFRRSEEGPRSFSDVFNSLSCWEWRVTDVPWLVHGVLDIVPSLAPSSLLCDPYLVWLFLICDPYSKFHLIAALCLQSRVYATIESGLIGSDVIGCDFKRDCWSCAQHWTEEFAPDNYFINS